MIEFDEKELLEEIEEFKKEKEKIKAIVGEIGGINDNHQHKIVNGILLVVIVAILVIGVALERIDFITTMLISILLGIFKLIWMLYEVQRVSHFQFWILNSLEFRINEIHKKVKKIEKELKIIEKEVKEVKIEKELEPEIKEPEINKPEEPVVNEAV